MVIVKIYVEGGGDRGELKTRCRQGFSAFFRKAGLEGRMPKVIACGSRGKALDKFRSALSEAAENDFIALLVDSEAPVARNTGPWLHLRDRVGDEWERPAHATDDNAHLMVQCMEAWFLADREALARYFGGGFVGNSLPRRLEIEEVPKSDIQEGLRKATRQCKRGRYEKASHSFAILAGLSPEKVTEASPHAKRFLSTLKNKLP